VAFTWPVKTVSRELSEVRKPEVRLQQLEVFSEVFEGFSSALLELVTYGPIGTNQARVNELREAAKFAYLPVKRPPSANSSCAKARASRQS
jgi:hypothetical protein